jgi:hypothetical protein
MDKSEKKRLKKLGKELVEQRSAELRRALNEANPIPISSEDAWLENYKTGMRREKWLRERLPVLHKKQWEKMFVLRLDDRPGCVVGQRSGPAVAGDGLLKTTINSAFAVVPTESTFIQCQSCETVLSVMPPRQWMYWKKCLCGNVSRLRLFSRYVLNVRSEDQIRYVRLVGKGSIEK